MMKVNLADNSDVFLISFPEKLDNTFDMNLSSKKKSQEISQASFSFFF